MCFGDAFEVKQGGIAVSIILNTHFFCGPPLNEHAIGFQIF